MADMLLPLKLAPGIHRNGTPYQAKNRWYDGNGVRFVEGTIQPIGGWQRVQDGAGADMTALTGVPRGAISWRTDAGDVLHAFGTHSHLFVVKSATLYDITPVGFTPGDVDSAIAGGAGTYGNGAYGVGLYGAGAISGPLVDAATWQLDVFGDYLVAVHTADRKLYVWTGNPAVVAAQAAGSPDCDAVVVTPERFLVALGAGTNVRLAQWASQESTTDWVPSATNTAGDFPLSTNGRLMAGRRTRSQTLLWTDTDLWAATYIGGLLLYRMEQVGESCGAISRRSMATFDTMAAWMGRDNFFVYDGFVKPLPCEVRDHVFGDMNTQQAAKVWATTVSQFGEVWWFYPSAGSTEVDRYVSYNYRENHWSIGELARTAGVDAGAGLVPVFAAVTGELYEHEVDESRTGMTTFLESGPVEIGDGNRLLQLQRVIPDERNQGDVSLTLYSRFFPNGTERTHGPFTLDRNPESIRVTARQIRVRYDEAEAVDWRVGTFRFGVREGARR